MRCGINALYLIPGGVGGTEIYLRNLLRGMAAVDARNEYIVFTNAETGMELVPHAPNFHLHATGVRASFRPARISYEQFRLPSACRRERLDVLLNPGFTSPAWGACPNVTVFHDLQHKRHPEYFRWFDLPFWNLLLRASARRSRELIAVSQATRADLRRFYGVDSTVVHHGVEREFFEIAARREPGDYMLCVSTLHPHKNLERLLRVHANAPELPRLVVAGLRGFAAAQLEHQAGERVEFTGWISRDRLYELYRGARAFVYPSTFEGFGMPVLEAMAAGVPVACSNIAPLREVASECAVYFDPASDRAMLAAIERVLGDGAALTTAARERASTFTWDRAARETIAVLERAAA